MVSVQPASGFCSSVGSMLASIACVVVMAYQNAVRTNSSVACIADVQKLVQRHLHCSKLITKLASMACVAVKAHPKSANLILAASSALFKAKGAQMPDLFIAQSGAN